MTHPLCVLQSSEARKVIGNTKRRTSDFFLGGGGDSHCLALPEEEDPGYQGIQHDGEEQRDHVENGKIDEVNGQVELPLDSVSTLHVPVLAHLSITAQPLLTAFDAAR